MAVFKCGFPFVLASASPRRRELLSWLGFEFTVCGAADEAEPLPGEKPEPYAARAAAEKARSVLLRLRDEAGAWPEGRYPVILAADTIVILDGIIYGKPRSRSQAHETLKILAGRTHEVVTSCCLLLPETAGPVAERTVKRLKEQPSAVLDGYQTVAFAQKSKVTMWDCPDEFLRAYVGGGEPMDKAGAYAVQGQGGFLVRAIEGSWSNVVGLPVTELAEILLEREVIHA